MTLPRDALRNAIDQPIDVFLGSWMLLLYTLLCECVGTAPSAECISNVSYLCFDSLCWLMPPLATKLFSVSLLWFTRSVSRPPTATPMNTSPTLSPCWLPTLAAIAWVPLQSRERPWCSLWRLLAMLARPLPAAQSLADASATRMLILKWE